MYSNLLLVIQIYTYHYNTFEYRCYVVNIRQNNKIQKSKVVVIEADEKIRTVAVERTTRCFLHSFCHLP